MRTQLTTRQSSTPSLRVARRRSLGRRLSPLVAGQCFDIDVTRELSGWLIRIPELHAVTHASRRDAVELAARECIAARTGIPIGYIAVRVSD
jgi:hypothetical protein